VVWWIEVISLFKITSVGKDARQHAWLVAKTLVVLLVMLGKTFGHRLIVFMSH